MAYQFHYTPTGTGVISGKEVLEQTEDAINDLSGQISGDVQIAIDTANNALNTANTASADAQNAINTANTAYTAATNAQNTANTAQNTASNALTAAQNAQNDVNALGNRVTTAEGNITQNTNAITGLTTRMGTAEGNIGNLQTAVSNAQATANTAQQTAATARQQSYVFRYSSTALVASSTNSNTLLDNTDNLKVGDKVIDSSGVIYSVTAIDTANSTFTVGSALIDLALDANVVHTSGNETKSGELTLNDTLYTSNIIPKSNDTYDYGTVSNLLRNLYAYHALFRGQQQGDEYSSNVRTNLTLLANRDTLGQSGCVVDTFRSNTSQGTAMHILGFGIKENSVRYEGVRLQWIWNSSDSGYDFNLKPTTQGTNKPVTYNLGTSADKWDTINGLEPSALGMPDLANGVDISSYITVNGGNKESLYTPTVNGWISVALTRTGGVNMAVMLKQGNFASSGHNIAQENGTTTCNAMLPVKGGVQVSINSVLADGIDFAYFYPCQGNV